MLWYLIARIVSREPIAKWLVRRAMRTPYTHISHDGSVYMERYWLFNSYERGPDKQERSKYTWFPWNIRIHWIRRADMADHMHDHPWNARTIILRGGYVEQRIVRTLELFDKNGIHTHRDDEIKTFTRVPGSTAQICFGQYHHISHVQPDGAWTLFISGPYKGTWGFLVDGVKKPWREYFAPGKADLIDPNKADE